MIEFLKIIISPLMFPFTALLCVVMLYWCVVIFGFLDMHIFDSIDFGFDGLGEGAEAAAGGAGLIESLFGFLGFGIVPVSIIFSFFVLQMWIMAYILNSILPSIIAPAIPLIVVFFGVALVVAIVSLFLTGLTTRPFRKIFKVEIIHGQHHLIGKICEVTSSKVTETFGEATITVEGSSPWLLMVRNSDINQMKKGDEAVITDYDKDKDVYQIKKI